MNKNITKQAVTIYKYVFIAMVVALSNAPSGMYGHEAEITLEGHNSPITAATFSSDDALIATGSEDGEIIIWHADGTIKHQFSGSDNQIGSVQFSEDNSLLLFRCHAPLASQVKIWNIETSELNEVFHGDPIRSTYLSQDKTKIVIVTAQLSCKVLDVVSGRCIFEKSRFISAQFLPDRPNMLVTLTAKGVMTTWDLEIQGASSREVRLIPDEYPHSILMSPDTKKLAIGYRFQEEPVIQILDTISNRSSFPIFSPNGKEGCVQWIAHHFQFSPDSTKFIYVTDNKTIYIRNIGHGTDIIFNCTPESQKFLCPPLNANNTKVLLASGDDHNTAVIYEVPFAQD